MHSVNEYSKKLNLTIEQIQKAASKREDNQFSSEKALQIIKIIDDLIEEDIITSMNELTNLYNQIEASMTDTAFTMEMVMKTLKNKPVNEAKTLEKDTKEVKKETPVKEKKEKEEKSEGVIEF